MGVLAVVIASVSMLVAALSLWWQVASWTMEGPRVKVVLREGIAGRGGVVARRVTRSGRPRDMSDMRAEGFTGPELIGVTATNVGRAKVQIVSFGFEMVRGGTTLEQVQSNALSASLPSWLEPGESGSWYITMQEARALVYATRGVRSDAGGVRAHVELGDGRKRKSAAYLDVPPAQV